MTHLDTLIITKKKITFFLPSLRMSEKCVSFGDKKIKKVSFTKTRKYLRLTT